MQCSLLTYDPCFVFVPRRLAVFSEESVPLFGPALPCPSIFTNHQEFRDFLLVKRECCLFSKLDLIMSDEWPWVAMGHRSLQIAINVWFGPCSFHAIWYLNLISCKPNDSLVPHGSQLSNKTIIRLTPYQTHSSDVHYYNMREPYKFYGLCKHWTCYLSRCCYFLMLGALYCVSIECFFNLCAVINGEKAAFNVPVFAQKRQRTLEMLIKNMYQDYMPDTAKVGLNSFPRTLFKAHLFFRHCFALSEGCM